MLFSLHLIIHNYLPSIILVERVLFNLILRLFLKNGSEEWVRRIFKAQKGPFVVPRVESEQMDVAFVSLTARSSRESARNKKCKVGGGGGSGKSEPGIPCSSPSQKPPRPEKQRLMPKLNGSGCPPPMCSWCSGSRLQR